MHSVAPLRASRELSEALELMTKALAILDEADAPGKIGATLDLAISCLSAVVGQDERASPASILYGRAETRVVANQPTGTRSVRSLGKSLSLTMFKLGTVRTPQFPDGDKRMGSA
jgi:hypothetical protein